MDHAAAGLIAALVETPKDDLLAAGRFGGPYH